MTCSAHVSRNVVTQLQGPRVWTELTFPLRFNGLACSLDDPQRTLYIIVNYNNSFFCLATIKLIFGFEHYVWTAVVKQDKP